MVERADGVGISLREGVEDGGDALRHQVICGLAGFGFAGDGFGGGDGAGGFAGGR